MWYAPHWNSELSLASGTRSIGISVLILVTCTILSSIYTSTCTCSTALSISSTKQVRQYGFKYARILYRYTAVGIIITCTHIYIIMDVDAVLTRIYTGTTGMYV